MRQAILSASVLLLSTLVFLPSAEARRAPTGPYYRLVTAAQAFEQHAGRIHGASVRHLASRFTRALHRRGQRNPHIIDERYHALRLAVHSLSIHDEAFLDAWDDLVISHRRYQRRFGNQQPVNPPVVVQPPTPPPHRPTYAFEGSFENMPVRFAGRSPDEVNQRCLQFAQTQRMSHVDDITIRGVSHRNGPSFWDANALCAIAALNSSSTIVVQGKVEYVPFAVGPDVHTAEQTLRTYLPRIMPPHVDDVIINGTPYRNGPSFWNAEAVIQMITSQMPAQPGRRPGRGRIRRAR